MKELEVYRRDCAHVDIISPQAFERIGPVLREVLGAYRLSPIPWGGG